MPSPSDRENKRRSPSSNSKIIDIIDRYEFAELGDRLEEYWLAESGDRYSLRELAEYVNHRLLQTVMSDAGMNLLEGEVENTYRLLTNGDISNGMRTQARRRLERAGVDVNRLESDLVSRQTVHTDLTKDRGVSFVPNEDDPLKREATNIRRLKRRMGTITGSKLDQLRSSYAR